MVGVGAESLVLGEGISFGVELLVVLRTQGKDIVAVHNWFFPSALSFYEIFLEKRGLLSQLVVY